MHFLLCFLIRKVNRKMFLAGQFYRCFCANDYSRSSPEKTSRAEAILTLPAGNPMMKNLFFSYRCMVVFGIKICHSRPQFSSFLAMKFLCLLVTLLVCLVWLRRDTWRFLLLCGSKSRVRVRSVRHKTIDGLLTCRLWHCIRGAYHRICGTWNIGRRTRHDSLSPSRSNQQCEQRKFIRAV
jgi:hypothetical protein